MVKHLYSQHDERADFYNHPMVSEIEPESFSQNITRSIKLCRDPKQLEAIADCKLLYLGTFDDETGKFVIFDEPRLLVECDKLVKETGYKAADYGIKDNQA